MKKYLGILTLGAMLLVACGPKKATKKTLAQLEECQNALSSAEARKAELVSKIDQLTKENESKKATIKSLEAERDSLSYWLHEVLEKGY